MKELLNKLLNNPKNATLIQFLKLTEEDNFKTWAESFSGYNEGGCILFENYGAFIPEENKFSLGTHSVMVNTNTGEIFAFNTGRCSIFFKCDFIKSGTENTSDLKTGYTFDCITDITALGDNWCFMDEFDNQKEELKWSFELTKTNNQQL
ncbi:hypothetical protein QWY90_03825 [Flavobacterium paronense]|uniref:DUF1579 domain-containing protein n=1 Tax=Flavobacterium paronense TaxID=1392775 RepID=A0ABV5GIK3_9FLAO|nr:hypothetical protein [Flavobacterium paronense]MDN3676433.1 hypothetical protein [Flavobacterium paronense]